MNADNPPLSQYCEECEREGFVRFIGENFFVRCTICNSETAQVYCPKCDMGGQFVRNIKKHPSSWKCPQCKKIHQLPNDFYEHSELLYFEENLPADLTKHIPKPKTPIQKAVSSFLLSLVLPIFLTVVMFIQSRPKTTDAFFISLKFSLAVWLAFLAVVSIPSYALETGNVFKKKNKKNWRTNQFVFLFIVGTGTLASLVMFISKILPTIAESQKHFAVILLLVATVAVFAILSGLYAIAARFVPLITRRKVFFIKHDSVIVLATLQILSGFVCLGWIYLLLYF